MIVQTFVGLVRQLMPEQRPGKAPSEDRDLPLTLLLQDCIATTLSDPALDQHARRGVRHVACSALQAL